MQEIERKFLVSPKEAESRILRVEGEELSQGYLAIGDDGCEVRIREKKGNFTLTTKHGYGLERREVEIAISHEQFSKLWQDACIAKIQKKRFVIHDGQFPIELDC